MGTGGLGLKVKTDQVAPEVPATGTPLLSSLVPFVGMRKVQLSIIPVPGKVQMVWGHVLAQKAGCFDYVSHGFLCTGGAFTPSVGTGALNFLPEPRA